MLSDVLYRAASRVRSIERSLPREGRTERSLPSTAFRYTYPAPAPEGFDGSVRKAVFQRLLRGLKPGRMADVGTGHGAFARVAKELGWEVTAVDARIERMPMDDGIRWVQSDIRDFELSGFDLISVLGLFYHLELADQLSLLGKCGGTPLILDTHVAEGPAVQVGGYRGQLFVEEVDEATASWGNIESFWPTERSLIRMIHAAGYDAVFKLDPPYFPLRTFYYCL